MKRCPTCNQEFTDEWLTFCTQDGTSLLDVETSPDEPPPTLVSPSLPPSVSPAEQPTLDMPGRYSPPPAQYIPPAPLQSGWAPPPPPPFPNKPQQSLAVTSLVLGILSVTLGLCCYFGILTGPTALVLGIISLVQIKNDPAKYGGKGFAIGGIVTGGLYFIILAAIIVFYGVVGILGSLK
ncbi:MAG TPA: DUF4190 domain-containing protein [Pyrinomonadaceae bacterium]|jgi:hypothetical protein|nr:DUF4190 domain-containing protein [Pyrinomonadaceae bacterium]